jgi:hypothetical protein
MLTYGSCIPGKLAYKQVLQLSGVYFMEYKYKWMGLYTSFTSFSDPKFDPLWYGHPTTGLDAKEFI